EIELLLHDELPGNRRLHSGETPNVHNPVVRMPVTAVGLYCAVVGLFDALVSMRTSGVREGPGAFNPQAVTLCGALGALNLGSGQGGQREPEGGALRRVVVRPQLSAMRFDDGPADRQADSQAAGLRRVERVEDALALLRRDAGARVGDRDEHALRQIRFGA